MVRFRLTTLSALAAFASLLPLGSPLWAAGPPASAPPAAKPRAHSETLHGTVKAAATTALTVTGTPDGDLQITLSPRGRALRAGKAATLSAFAPGDAVMIRGHQAAPGQFTATLVEDAATEALAAQERRPPLMKVQAVDAKTGAVTLVSETGSLRLDVLPSRIREGRKEMGAALDLQPGETYRVRLTNGPDGQPAVTLAPPGAGSTRSRRTR